MDFVKAILQIIVLMSEARWVERAVELVAIRPVARRHLLVELRVGKFLNIFFAIALLVLQAILAVGGRYAKRPVDGAVAAEEPADGADTNALLDRVSLPQQQGQTQTGLTSDLLLEKLLEARVQRKEMAHMANG